MVALPSAPSTTRPAARPALHHLERGLFEGGAETRPPNGAVRLLEAGGERAEAEIVGAEVLELMRDGVAAEDIAVLVRGAGPASLFAQVLGTYGIPVAWSRRVPLARTRLGAGVLAGARAALPGGRAEDLLAWLRTPGMAGDGGDGGGPWTAADAVDALEARVRRAEVVGAREAAGEVGARGRCRGSTRSPPRPRPGRRRCSRRWWPRRTRRGRRPHARRADVLDPEERDEARVAAALRSAAAELRSLDPELLGGAEEVLEALGAVEVRQGDETEGVLLTDPLQIRARRFRAVFVCGLQDGEFPQRPVPEPFLDDDARRALSVAAGLRLPFHEDVLDRERSLFYACVSRPQEVLFLSWRSSDEEGEPLVASPFLDDVRALFTDELWEQRGRRLLAEVTWSPREAPTPRELQRAQAAARNEPDPPPLPAPVSEPVLAQLDARRTEGARQLETFAACGVRWLVEALLHPARVTPDPDAMRRGSRAHAVLETTLRRLKDATGSAALTPASLPAALRALDEALDGIELEGANGRGGAPDAGGRPPALPPPRGRARRGAGADRTSSGASGARATSTARSRSATSRSPGGSTASTSAPAARRSCATTRARAPTRAQAGPRPATLQVALYMLAARELLGLEPVGGLYQALWSRDSRPRGLVRDDVPGRYVAHGQGLGGGAGRRAGGGSRAGARDGGGAAGGRGPGVPGASARPRAARIPTICRAGG